MTRGVIESETGQPTELPQANIGVITGQRRFFRDVGRGRFFSAWQEIRAMKLAWRPTLVLDPVAQIREGAWMISVAARRICVMTLRGSASSASVAARGGETTAAYLMPANAYYRGDMAEGVPE